MAKLEERQRKYNALVEKFLNSTPDELTEIGQQIHKRKLGEGKSEASETD